MLFSIFRIFWFFGLTFLLFFGHIKNIVLDLYILFTFVQFTWKVTFSDVQHCFCFQFTSKVTLSVFIFRNFNMSIFLISFQALADLGHSKNKLELDQLLPKKLNQP